MSSLGQNLDLRMSQSLVMSPRMQQAIKILQYNHLEMLGAVQEALLENPTLEASHEVGESLHEPERAREQVQPERSESGDSTDGGVDWERLLEHIGDRRSTASLGGTIHEELPPIEANLTYGESLSEHLLWQLRMVHLTDPERQAAEAIILHLDERGFLTSSIDEIALAAGVDLEDAQSVLELVQGLDPVGCGAADLVESLVIQARALFPEDPTFERILRGHLTNLERRNYAAIAKDLGLELEDVIEYHRMIQELEPCPGRAFTQEEPRYISPDLYVEKVDGEWNIVLNEEGLPELKVSSYYLKVLRTASRNDRRYLVDKLRGAEFLIKSIAKRQQTIHKVMRSIIKFQGSFFDRGADHLRPLVLQDIADDIGVHMSTVSRVTTNKYVHTPHGMFELKYFFSAGLRQQSGEDLAAEAVKSRIRSMVQAENARKPLSDQQICDVLKKEGVKVARRTVAKYREAMGILPSSQRKQLF